MFMAAFKCRNFPSRKKKTKLRRFAKEENVGCMPDSRQNLEKFKFKIRYFSIGNWMFDDIPAVCGISHNGKRVFSSKAPAEMQLQGRKAQTSAKIKKKNKKKNDFLSSKQFF